MAEAVAAVPGTSAGPSAVVTSAQGFSHPSGIVPQLQNVVSTVNLGCPLDLASIAQRARNAEYNPKRFAACIVRIKEPKTTALMFSSGKMVIAGAKSEDLSRLAARKYTKILMKLGYDVTFTDFTVQNMVASCSVNFPIRLEGLAARFDIFCNYEPEVFPGLVFRMKSPTVVLLIFVTGKIVLTGAKKVEQIYEAFENVYAVLQDFKKDDARRFQMTPGTAVAATPALPAPGSSAGTKVAIPGADALGLGIPKDVLADASVPAPGPDARQLPPPSAPMMLPPPTPAPNALPPPTPGPVIPAPTPAGAIPPPTPAQGLSIPPPTPSQVPPPGSVPPPTPGTVMLPPPPG